MDGDDFITEGQVVTHTFMHFGTYTATVMASNPVTTTLASTQVVIEPRQAYLPLILRPMP